MRWSTITELLAKLITPVVNMALARILAPEAFGVLATVTMVLSFAEIFVESGFQKFLIQHNFEDKSQEHRYMSVAFWSNLCFSALIWGVVILFRNPIAALAGNEGLGFPLALAGLAIPLYGIIGIQNCQLKKRLDFKSLFFVRIISAFVPLAVTLPLAALGMGYWSLIIGNIASLLLQSVLLVIFGKFKPAVFFRWDILRHMLSYGVWSILDGLACWGTAWVDSLMIAQFMSDYYLGLYKHSAAMVTSLFGIVTAAVTPVLLSALSKLQDDQKEFNKTFLKLQKTLCTFMLPLSVGVFLYRELAALVLFGNKWLEAADIIGVLSLATMARTLFVRIYSEVYRAKGKFQIPLYLQIADLAILIPACMISVRSGFWPLVYTRALVQLDLVIPEMIIVWVLCGISLKDTFGQLAPATLATALMALVSVGLQSINSGTVWSVISIGICVIVYFAVLFLFKKERETYLIPLVNVWKEKVK